MTAPGGRTASGNWILLALGGTLVLAIAFLLVPRGSHSTGASAASTQGPLIESRVPDAALPRDGVVLQWTPMPGATYSLSVTDERGADLHNARDLHQPEYAVPASAFASVPANGRIVWRVGASLPNRSRITSREFFAIIK